MQLSHFTASDHFGKGGYFFCHSVMPILTFLIHINDFFFLSNMHVIEIKMISM